MFILTTIILLLIWYPHLLVQEYTEHVAMLLTGQQRQPWGWPWPSGFT